MTTPAVIRSVEFNAPAPTMESPFPHHAVILNVYDISPINGIMASFGVGLHHAGVEVNGVEYQYGRAATGSGVSTSPPRHCAPHIFREQYILGCCSISNPMHLEQLVSDMISEETWSGTAYHIIHHNCNHFAEALISRLLPVETRMAHAVRGEHKLSSTAAQSAGGGYYQDVETEVLEAGGETRRLGVLMPPFVNRLSRLAADHLPSALIAYIESLDNIDGMAA